MRHKKRAGHKVGEKGQTLLCLSAATSNYGTLGNSGYFFTSTSQIFHKLLFGPTLSEPYMEGGTGNIIPNVNTLLMV